MIVAAYHWRTVVVALFFLGISPLAHAHTDPAPAAGEAAEPLSGSPQEALDEAQKRLASLAESPDVPAELKTQLTETLQKLIDSLKKTIESQARRKRLEELAAAAPTEILRARAELERTLPPPQPIAPGTPLETLRALKVERDAQLAARKKFRSEVAMEINDRKTRRAQAPQLISEITAELQRLESEVPAAEGEEKIDPRLIFAQRMERAARVELFRERLARHQQDLRTIEAEQDLLPEQLNLADRDIAHLEKEVAALTQAVSNRREIRVEEALRAHREGLLADSQDPESSKVLREFGPLWIEVVKKWGVAEREKNAEAKRAEELAAQLKNTKEEIRKDRNNGGTIRSVLGLKLQRQRAQLPATSKLHMQIADVDARIEDMGALQTQLEVAKDEMLGRGIMGGRTVGSRVSESVVQKDLARLQEISNDIDAYLMDLVELEGHLLQIRKTAADLRSEIDSSVLWIRNARPYAITDLVTAWHSFQWIMDPAKLHTLWQSVIGEMLRRPAIVLLWLLSSGVLFGFGPRLRRQIALLGEKAAKRNQTAMRPTLRVMWMSGLLALPLLTLLGIPGWRLSELSDPYVQAIGNSLLFVAIVVLPLELLRQLVRRNGLAVRHFGLREEHAHTVRAALRFTIDSGMPLALLWGIAYHSGHSAISASLGRPLFFCGMLLMALVLWRIMHPQTGVMCEVLEKYPGGWLDRLRYVWHPALAGVPVVLGVLSLSGYSYSARQLAEQLYWTLWLVIALVIIGGVMRRWVTISRRRLILAQARQRASEAERREGAPIEVNAESHAPDLTEINAQTLRLIHAVLTVMAVVGLAYMWAPVFPAVQFLDKPLWGTISVTWANLVTALPILLLTVVSVRNVPGLMETVLLQRLPLESAARYAITTLSSYALLVLGVVASANTLGLRWESIQWLVAALGVGLGFGLQEIFANFVSGIILLFEQPIRVGDVVTLDGTTGAVARIRMRATTVINWDRQELIIPNKDLITGRLINWTLSDSTNRVVINVGIAYGSDTRKACELLERICDDHINVAEDPAPVIAFESFGESSLNLVVRCFLKTLDVRVRTIHELHTEINERFHRAGIDIAFPQRDLHIRSLPEGFTALVKDAQAA